MGCQLRARAPALPPTSVSSTLRRFASSGGALPPEVLGELAARLAAGEVVAIPTETVYGLAVRADSAEALERLRSLKGRDADAPLTWHVGDAGTLAGAVELPNVVARLAARYWPGPLTLVVRPQDDAARRVAEAVGRDGWVGVRHPAHEATAALLASLDFPVVATSANRSGEPPLCDPDAVAEAFGDGLAGLVDDGPTRLQEASTVLRVGRGSFELLREGLLAADELRRTAGLRIAFVCTGNTCRSPMAEALCRDLLAERLGVAGSELGRFGFSVESMGVFAGEGAPASEHAVEVMAAQDLDLSRHRARVASLARVAELDAVFGLTASHVEALVGILPPRQRELVTLLDPDGADVPDPIGGSRADYEACAASIATALERRAATWI